MTQTASSDKPSMSVYADRRMLRILLLGAISGFPWVLIGSALSLWLKEDGMSRSTIGWASLIFGVYTINFLWAPLIDRIRIPWLTERVGHRKAWILCLQFVMVIALLAWSNLSPSENLALVIAVGLAIAISSASQDITIDALRIEQVDRNESAAMAAGAAVAVVGWWTGYKLGGFIALMISDALQNSGVTDYWQVTFQILAVLIVIMNALLLLIPEASWRERQLAQAKDQAALGSAIGSSEGGAIAWLGSTVIAPFLSFFRQNGVKVALAFSLMAWSSEPSILLFAAAVLIDDVTASIATVIFVTFISLLVDRTYTATQYALLASLGTAGRTLLAASSGAMVDFLDGDWGLFFIITALMVIPSLVLLLLVRKRFSAIEESHGSEEVIAGEVSPVNKV